MTLGFQMQIIHEDSGTFYRSDAIPNVKTFNSDNAVKVIMHIDWHKHKHKQPDNHTDRQMH